MEGLTFVDIKDIIHCESQSAYCYVHLTGDRKVLLSRHLKEISEILEPLGFLRVHNSHLIHPDYVAHYYRGEGGEIVLVENPVRDGVRLLVKGSGGSYGYVIRSASGQVMQRGQISPGANTAFELPLGSPVQRGFYVLILSSGNVERIVPFVVQ